MSRKSHTEKRLSKIKTRHDLAATLKPEVASIGNGKAKSGFGRKLKAKQSKGFKSSSAPKNTIKNFWS